MYIYVHKIVFSVTSHCTCDTFKYVYYGLRTKPGGFDYDRRI